ncbi:uncharacterized protein E0L32_010631 [Thyridium curvatum]|uniref:Nephrocystin 3-like N-terminal domain-containing protein n=1 Tax=Thyridium curvatum TaxID=1093900 RepID=A0A507AEK6_9PEZI|nr:uncharacterized protein E0L32_010631 [Thyridium curvatum]TPX07735.1 hypothetical protein E0L32_010631 [Thyridium curvatum]
MKRNKPSIPSSGLAVIYEPDGNDEAIVDSRIQLGRASSQDLAGGGSKSRAGARKNVTEERVPEGFNQVLKPTTQEIKLDFEKGRPGGHHSTERTQCTEEESRLQQVRVKNCGESKSRSRTETKRLQPIETVELDFIKAEVARPRPRIETLSTNGKLLPAQLDVFGHGDEMLHDLAILREKTKTKGRSLVFITHSLGGIVVKEALRRSENMGEPSLKDVLHSTRSILFIGCPHRDSQYGKLSHAVRNMASTTLKVAADDAVLRDLSGAVSANLNLNRLAFLRLWNNYNFRVKTFHEKVAIDAQRNRALTDLTLRREASFLGDPREQAEGILGDHIGICRYRAMGDEAYRSLSFTLMKIIHDETHRLRPMSDKEQAFLRTIGPARPPPQEAHSQLSYPGTCLWLYDMPEFRAWYQRVKAGRGRLLWVKGKPGSGKSILLKSLRSRVEKQWEPLGASLIWSTAEGKTLDDVFSPGAFHRPHQTSPAAVYRNLLAQLFEQDPRLRKALLMLEKRKHDSGHHLEEFHLVSFFLDDYVDQKIETPTLRTFIFVDAADDCGAPYLEELVYSLSQLAQNSDFSICLASSSLPQVFSDNATEIVMHQRNVDDILRFVSLNLIAEWEDRNHTVVEIGHKAGGCFLWAEIVVNILNSAIMEGATQEMIEDTIIDLPDEIDDLYAWLFSTLSPEEKAETMTLMQWVILASEPMRLNDLRIAMQVTKRWHPHELKPYMTFVLGPAGSLRDFPHSASDEGAFDTPYHFQRWMRLRSIGLVELRAQGRDGVMYEPLGMQRVQVIHESVRNFFLSGRGFACLSSASHEPPEPGTYSPDDLIDHGHLCMLNACLAFLNMTELDPLGQGNCSVAPMSPAESKYWRQNVRDQRRLVMSSYPFLQYAVDNLVYHLLSPRLFRFFLPQREILRTLSANRSRLWRRWTALLGCNIADPTGTLHACHGSHTRNLLSPVCGARYRLERVFRKLSKMAAMERYETNTPSPVTPKSTKTSSSYGSSPRYFAGPAPYSAHVAKDLLKATTPLAKKLEATALWKFGRWGASKGVKKPKADRSRVNIVDPKLCDDIIAYIGSSLERHKGCDLIDIYPGAGLWSQKLHDLLQPRSHILMEPDETFYRPFLEPLLKMDTTTLVRKSGIVWRDLNDILNPTYLPHQTERAPRSRETPERNDTLLVVANLAFHPKKSFRSFDSVANLVLFQFISSIRASSLFQKYGLVRMLIWCGNDDKVGLIPRSLQRRKRLAIDGELSTDWICEIAGVEDTNASGNRWFVRDRALDLQSAQEMLQKLDERGISIPEGRESQLIKEIRSSKSPLRIDSSKTMPHLFRPYQEEKRELEEQFSAGLFDKKSDTFLRLRDLRYRAARESKKANQIIELLDERDALAEQYEKGEVTDELKARTAEWNDSIDKLVKEKQHDYLLYRDNQHIFDQDPRLLNWDRRYVEPLAVKGTEFFPNAPCCLLDIQPKAVHPLMREMGPSSNRAGDIFELVLRGLLQLAADPVSKALESVWPGAAEGVLPHCPSLRDRGRGGMPFGGFGEVSVRTLNEAQLVEILEAWMKWPFRPTYSQLVGRVSDDPGTDVEDEHAHFD